MKKIQPGYMEIEFSFYTLFLQDFVFQTPSMIGLCKPFGFIFLCPGYITGREGTQMCSWMPSQWSLGGRPEDRCSEMGPDLISFLQEQIISWFVLQFLLIYSSIMSICSCQYKFCVIVCMEQTLKQAQSCFVCTFDSERTPIRSLFFLENFLSIFIAVDYNFLQ